MVDDDVGATQPRDQSVTSPFDMPHTRRQIKGGGDWEAEREGCEIEDARSSVVGLGAMLVLNRWGTGV